MFKALSIEKKKLKGTGIVPGILLTGLVGAVLVGLTYFLRRDQLLNLPGDPVQVLLAQLYGILTLLNMLALILSVALSYDLERRGQAIKYLYFLPYSLSKMYLAKLIILASLYGLSLLLEFASLAGLMAGYLGFTADRLSLLVSAFGLALLSSLPVLTGMVLVASRCQNLWTSLGIGLAGLLTGLALANFPNQALLLHPFVLMFQPSATMTFTLSGDLGWLAGLSALFYLSLGLYLPRIAAMNRKELVSMLTALKVECLKLRRSHILPLILIAPLLIVLTGIHSISAYFTPEYKEAWGAMFIQSCLLYAYYLLPFTMIVLAVMVTRLETKDRGMVKLLSLPVKLYQVNLAKFLVLVAFLGLEILFFLLVFLLAGFLATHWAGIDQAVPLSYLVSKCLGIFLTMLPCLACIWQVHVLISQPFLSIALNLFLVIPSILLANTSLWALYPYCYSGYYVSCAMADFQEGIEASRFNGIAALVFGACFLGLALLLSSRYFAHRQGR